MKLSEELRKRTELAEAWERGERVMHTGPIQAAYPADERCIRVYPLDCLFVTPRTIRIGDRDVPMPVDCSGERPLWPRSGLGFESPEDRRAFDDAVMRLVREGE